MGLKLIKKHWFYFTIGMYITLGGYVLLVAYITPYLGIEIKEVQGKWEIDEVYSSLENKHSISKGDIVLSIDNVPINNISNIYDTKRILAASELSIQKNNGQIININIYPADVPYLFYTLIILPSVYLFIALGSTFYLYYKKSFVPHLKFLITFILTVALAYASTGASSGGNTIGRIINSGCMLLCLVILVHFLKNYFTFLKIRWSFVQNIKILYILPISASILRFIKSIYPKLGLFDSILILIIFSLLLLYILYILIFSYFQHRVPQLKLLFIGLVFPFLPFLILYVLPELLIQQSIMNADICALFLLLIPFNITFLQLTERLFDIAYHITRLRYYATYSLFFSSWLIMGIHLINDVSLTKLLFTVFFMFLSCILFLYIKEKVDYHVRKIIFSTRGNYIHKLYQTIEKIGRTHHVEQMLQTLTIEIKSHLEVKDVAIITYSYETESIVSSNSYEPLPDVTIFPRINVGEIIKKDDTYFALIHQDKEYIRWLLINYSQAIRLKAEELLWLELLLMYINSFIESTKVIEELIDELNQLQQKDIKEPAWLKKLVWTRVEDEKFQLAQELHDTILQEHIHIARQVDGLIDEKDLLAIKSKLKNLHEQMVLSINSLRSYCETLKPPLLTNIGLNAALERLFEQTANQASFKLTTRLNRLYLEDSQLNLGIYRIVQELLNNAMKHSQAENVELYLQEFDDVLELVYRDNGIGCNIEEVWHNESMGLQGIRERVEVFNGEIKIDSNINEGMCIQIKLIERSDVLDFSINSR